MSYKPQPGTFPARAIAHLKTLPAGTELSSAELSEALDVEVSTVSPGLMYALRNGGVVSRKEGGLLFWSLPRSEEPDSDRAEDPPIGARGDGPGLPPAPLPAPAPVDPQPAAKARPARFRAGLFTDGTLLLERGADRMELRDTEVDQLVDLLKTARVQS